METASTSTVQREDYRAGLGPLKVFEAHTAKLENATTSSLSTYLEPANPLPASNSISVGRKLIRAAPFPDPQYLRQMIGMK